MLLGLPVCIFVLCDRRAAPKKCVFLSTSKNVRNRLKCWAVSDAGDKCSVKLDIRDLCGHLDSTLRARAVTLGYRISVTVPRAVAVLPLDFCGRLRILRTIHLPAALHGVEAAFGQAAMSGGLRLANPCAVLSLLDGPVGSDPGFHVVWCRFRFIFCCPVLRLLGFLRIRIYVFGQGPVCLLFVTSLVLFSFFERQCGMLGELRLLVTLFLGLVFGVAGIWTFEVL